MTKTTSLGSILAKLHRLHLAAVKGKLQSLDVQPGHLPFLIALLDNETPMIQDDIASHALIDKSVAARGIEYLEKQGFIRRCVNPGNRRQKLVEPTPMTTNIKEELLTSLNRASEGLLSALSPSEQNTVMELLDRMLQCGLKK